MQEDWNPPPLAGQPMSRGDLLDEMALLALPEDGMIVTIDEARAELKIAQRHLYTLQALQDEAHDLTEELEILVDGLSPTDPHVVEVADQLGRLVHEWQHLTDQMSKLGARIAGFEPGLLEWYGVVDGHLVMYSWCQGEEDIEWWYPIDAGLSGRRPLVEA